MDYGCKLWSATSCRKASLSAIILVVETAMFFVGTRMFCKQVTRSEKALPQE